MKFWRSWNHSLLKNWKMEPFENGRSRGSTERMIFTNGSYERKIWNFIKMVKSSVRRQCVHNVRNVLHARVKSPSAWISIKFLIFWRTFFQKFELLRSSISSKILFYNKIKKERRYDIRNIVSEVLELIILMFFFNCFQFNFFIKIKLLDSLFCPRDFTR